VGVGQLRRKRRRSDDRAQHQIPASGPPMAGKTAGAATRRYKEENRERRARYREREREGLR
jgi:hypothetical protein